MQAAGKKSKPKRKDQNKSNTVAPAEKQPRRQRPRARGKTMAAGQALSRPAVEYARAMANPFSGPLATIPDFPSVPSRRIRCFSRGYFYAGTAGVGYVLADPYLAATNDLNSVYTSDSTYPGTSLAVAGLGVVPGKTNPDYSSTDFGIGALAQGRIIGAGLRVKYSGTELNRGGVLLGITSPNHQSLVNFDFTDVDKFDCSVRFRPGEKWNTTLYCPVSQDELLYGPTLGSKGGSDFTGAYVYQGLMAFMIQAPTVAVGAAFQYEFYLVYELQGVAVRGIVPSVSDPTGFSAVQTTAQLTMMRAHDMHPDTRADLLVQHVGQVAAETISGWAGRAASSALNWVEHNGSSVLSALGTGLSLLA